MAKVTVDLAYCMELQTFLKMLDDSKGKLTDWMTEGPGGGNPCVTLEFPTEEDALTFLEVLYPEDPIEFRQSRVVTR